MWFYYPNLNDILLFLAPNVCCYELSDLSHFVKLMTDVQAHCLHKPYTCSFKVYSSTQYITCVTFQRCCEFFSVYWKFSLKK